MGIFKTIRWYYRQWRYGPFNEWIFPVIENMSSENFIDDLVSVQSMTDPIDGFTIPWEFLDENNPKVGQIFHDTPKDDDPGCGCCLRSMWHKIWTGSEWVFERNLSQEEWKSIIAKFHSKK